MSIIDFEFIEKMEKAIHFNFENGFEPLRETFMQRKKVAEALKDENTKELKEMFNYLNNEISKYLGINNKE